MTKKLKILVAEDERFLAKVISNKLIAKGYDAISASDGEEAIRLIKEHKPDLVYLDIIMPSKGGFEVLKEIKADASTKSIPVIMYSNLAQEEDKAKAKKLGALDYVVKSDSSLEDAISKLESFLHQK
jgi:CheY-like chemotaxis protein